MYTYRSLTNPFALRLVASFVVHAARTRALKEIWVMLWDFSCNLTDYHKMHCGSIKSYVIRIVRVHWWNANIGGVLVSQ